MKKLTTLLLLFLSISLYSQEGSKWKIGILSSFDLNSSNQNIVTDGNINGYIIDDYKTNFSIGLVAKYEIQQFYLRSGILYSNKDFEAYYNCATCEYIVAPGPPTIEIISNSFISVPFSVGYKILKSKLSPIIELGVVNNFESKNTLKDISNKYLLEGTIGGGINYKVSRKLSAELNYNYRTSLNEYYNTGEYKLKSHSISLNFYCSL